MSRNTSLSVVLTGMMLGCGDAVHSTSKDPLNTTLLSAKQVQTISLTDLKGLAQLSGNTSVAALVRYEVDTYRIVYETSYQGEKVKASGLLFIPKGSKEPAPLISLQHGTTFVKGRIPSSMENFTGMEYFASAGYVAMMPDYVGYGSSDHLFHPYYDREHSAVVVIDMIRSAKEFLNMENVRLTDDLFMAGYSEGGYVTLAAAHELETNPEHQQKITAVAAGAGGYDLLEMLETVTTQRHYSYPSYLAFVLMSYNTTYNWNRPLEYFFQKPYADILKTHMNGQYDGWQINSRLSTEVTRLLDPAFLQRLKQPDDEAQLKRALAANSVRGWKTSLPIKLFHGTRDEIIPHGNSAVTLESFKEAGSTSVTLTLIPGGTHGGSFIPMLQQFIPWFETLRKDRL
jgi:pimeloyl-ACP methyl ester carboxylesterase